MIRNSLMIVALSFMLANSVHAEPPDWVGKVRPQIKARRLEGKGNWKATGKKSRSIQRWSLDVDRDEDGSLHGSVVISDSPLLASGRVRGAIEGRHLSGTIADAGGNDVAEFRGVVSDDGVRGTYTDRTGETGDWVWEGPLPE